MLWRKIKFYGVLVVILFLAGLTVYFYFFGGRSTKPTIRQIDAPAMLQQIQDLNELVSVSFGVQKIIGLEEEKVPFGSEKLLLMVRAKVLGGVDLSQLTVKDLDFSTDGILTIKLPPPKLLHVYVDEQHTQTWNRQKTWWTPWVDFNPDLERKARLAALESVRVAALEMGILEEAQQNAELTIARVLAAVGVEQVQFARDVEQVME